MREYQREKVVNYAYIWWNITNPRFFNYEGLGGDCTNFASQCIFAGSEVMNFNRQNGWFYINANDKSASWTAVEYLKNFLLSNRTKGPFAKLCDLSEIELGDLIQIKQTTYYNHSLIVTKIDNGEVYVTAHTNNVLNKPLKLYYPKEIRCFKILGVYD